MKLHWNGFNKDFKQDNTIKDYDGNEYTEVVIGTQTWLVEPLKTSHYADGTPMILQTTNTNQSLPRYRNYDNIETYVNDFGRLYNHYLFINNQTNLISGYHYPSHQEFETLWDFGGGRNYEEKFMATGTDYWDTSKGTDEFGWKGVGSGFGTSSGFSNIKQNMDLYDMNGDLWVIDMTTSSIKNISQSDLNFFFPIRLIKD